MYKRILICAALLAACGKSSSTGGGSAASGGSASGGSGASGASGGGSASAAPTGPQDHCEVKITGDVDLSFTASGPRSTSGGGNPKVSVATDYWMSDEDIHDALKMMNGALSKKSDDEIAKEVDEQMKKDPKFMLLLLNCGDENNFFSFGPGNGSKYADVPFKPGSYHVVDGSRAPGEFSAMIGLHPNGKHESFSLAKDEPGQFEIKKFDLTGIAGTFHLKAKNYKGDKTIVIDGSFDYGCKGRLCK